jgi:nucleotide-binding universal stress UspA family protein
MYRKILLANEGTIEANGAFGPSLVLASRFDAELHMILVEELPRFPVTISEVVGEKRAADSRSAYIVASAQRRATEARVKFRAHVVIGRMIDRVIAFVNENQIDLLVIGLKKPLHRWHFFVGNAPEQLIRLAPCAVHVVK